MGRQQGRIKHDLREFVLLCRLHNCLEKLDLERVQSGDMTTEELERRAAQRENERLTRRLLLLD